MSTTDLKKRIIDEINNMDNADLLLEVCQLLEIDNVGAELYPLSEEQIAAVHKSQEQVRQGKFMSETEADKDLISAGFLSF